MAVLLFLTVDPQRFRAALVAAGCLCAAAALAERARAETQPATPPAFAPTRGGTPSNPRATATIHWRGVTLREAVERLESLFRGSIFVDRRVDPTMRVDLDTSATSAEQVLGALAAKHELGVARLRNVVYLGPLAAAQQVPALVARQSQQIARLPREARPPFVRRRPLQWQRLTEPRQIIASIVEAAGGHVLEAERIPFDLWDANELTDLSLAESLTILLIGFDLTFELRVADRAVLITPLDAQSNPPTLQPPPANRPAQRSPPTVPPARGGRQLYTLRVQEKPVGAVLRELARQLNWSLQIDEAAIRAAGKSLDTRVSFSVENVDREKLLHALLAPANLEWRIEGNTIRVVPPRYSN